MTPEPVVERIVHAPADAAKPAPGAEVKTPEPAATDETANADQPTDPAETTEQKQSKFQRRLDRQKTARVAAETEARLLREERDRLRAALEGQARPQQQQPESSEPNRDNFPDYEAYLRAVTRWEAGQEADKRLRAEYEARQGQEQQRQRTEQVTAHQERLAKAWTERENALKATAPDYDKIVNEYLQDAIGDITPESRAMIIESDVGPQLLHHLAAHPDEAERIAELSPRRQLIELGKLEEKLPKIGSKKTTSAPPPASTVRHGSNAADHLRENMTQAEVAAYMKSHGSRWVS